jgi:YHS domain-containing protein
MEKIRSLETDQTNDKIARNRPAIGLVATRGDADHTVGTILRAREYGHHVLVTGQKEENEALNFARSLGTTVVTPSDDLDEAKDPKVRLAQAARAKGYPGLLFHPDPSERIHFSSSYEALEATEWRLLRAATRREILSTIGEFDVTLLAGGDWSPDLDGTEFALTCAECGNTVDSEGSAARIDGTLYQFCCPSCEARFEEKYESLRQEAD